MNIYRLSKNPIFHVVIIGILLASSIYFTPAEHNLFHQDLLDIEIDKIVFQLREDKPGVLENVVIIELLIFNHLWIERKVSSNGDSLNIDVRPFDTTETINITQLDKPLFLIFKPGLTRTNLRFKISYHTPNHAKLPPQGNYEIKTNLCLVRYEGGICLNKLDIVEYKFTYSRSEVIICSTSLDKASNRRPMWKNLLTHHWIYLIISLILTKDRLKIYYRNKHLLIKLYPVWRDISKTNNFSKNSSKEIS